MLVKIMGGRGSGGGAGPINYLLGENRDRNGARLLRGHPDRTAMLIDSLEFRQKYVSGVLSFEESDISEEQKQAIMDSFQQALLPDMSERTNWLWVEHKDKNRLELNFVIPTVDLETGKRVQPYYHRADLNRVDAWKSLTNDVYRFTDPNDPIKAQTLTLRTNESADRKSFKTAIDDYISKLFASGQINNRDELIAAVEQHGLTATRKTKSSVTFTHSENGQKFRMKGAFYGEHFRSRKEIQTRDRERDSETETDREQRISRNRERLNRAMEIKREYIRKRYESTQQKNDQNPRRVERENEFKAQIELSYFSSDDYVERDANNYWDYIRGKTFLQRSVQGIGNSTLQLWDIDVCRGDVYDSVRENLSRHKNSNKQKDRLNDRDREIIIGTTEQAIDRIRNGSEGVKRDLREKYRQRIERYRFSNRHSSEVTKRAIGRFREIGQRHSQLTESVENRVRALADRTRKNNRVIERNQHLILERIEQRRKKIRKISRLPRI